MDRDGEGGEINVDRDGEGSQAAVKLGDAESPLVLALDIGTSSARAVLYDALGRAVEGVEAHRPFPVQTSQDGGVTIDPAALMEHVGQCIDQVCALMPHRPIAAVACDTFWHSVMGTDAHGEPLTPIFTWADTRSRHAAEELRARLDEASIHARTGCVLHSSFLPAKFVWLAETQPEVTRATRYWISFAEYLYWRLFGERRISISMASATGLFDQSECHWDPELLSVLPIDDRQLSPITEFSQSMSGLQKPYASRWPALAQVPWYLGLGDGACNNIGSGGYCADWAVAMIGTSGAIRVVRADDRVEVPRGLWTFRVDGTRFVQGGSLSDGGNVFAWMVHTLRLSEIGELEGQLAQMAPDAHGLTVLPFLAGERSPDWRADARAALVGMTLATRPVDIVRASLEAVAYRFGVVYELLKRNIPQSRGIIGSGAGLIHSPAWLQIMTDVLGEPVSVCNVPEATSRGAALLVLESLGELHDLANAPVPMGEVYEPDADRRKIYLAALERQQRLYDRIMAT